VSYIERQINVVDDDDDDDDDDDEEVEAEIKASHQSINFQQHGSSFINIKSEVTLCVPCINSCLSCFCHATDNHPVMWQLIGFLILTSLAIGLSATEASSCFFL